MKLDFTIELFNTLEQFLLSLNNDKTELYIMHDLYRRESDMPFVSWIKRIYTMSRCSSSCLVMAAYFLKKISVNNPCLIFSKVNLRRLFLTAVMISAKMHEDRTFKNVDWINIGEGYYELDTLNRMECEFLNLLNYELFLEPDHYDTFCDYLAYNYQTKPDEIIDSSSVSTPVNKVLKVKTPDVTNLIGNENYIHSPLGNNSFKKITPELKNYSSIKPQPNTFKPV